MDCQQREVATGQASGLSGQTFCQYHAEACEAGGMGRTCA